MRILDAHTHLSGSEFGESPEGILETLDALHIDKAFIFAPLLDVRSWLLNDTHLEDIRTHNDYCANLASVAPDRLLGFCVLDPSPALAEGNKARAVDLMRDEVKRCYDDLGLRGIKMVPHGWYPDDAELVALYQTIAELGMYVVFHAGIFLDGREGRYCRPAFYEGVHQVPEMHAQLAHVGWPWVDECLAVLAQETLFEGNDPSRWQLRADLSFGPPEVWQLETWQKALAGLPHQMIGYASDIFWPGPPDRYDNQYLRPQLGLFETAATTEHIAEEGSPQRIELRQHIFYDNIWNHWQGAVREAQQPLAAKRTITTPRAKGGRPGKHGQPVQASPRA
ncbi:MAG TPA: amidohydrolase family protein [Chloroflexota bacterium]